MLDFSFTSFSRFVFWFNSCALLLRTAVQNALGGSKIQKMNRPSVLSARGHIVSLCPYRHMKPTCVMQVGFLLCGLGLRGVLVTVTCLFFVLGNRGEACACRPPPLKCQSFCQFSMCSWMIKCLLDRRFVRSGSCRHSVNFQMLFLQVSVDLVSHAFKSHFRSETSIIPLGSSCIAVTKHR